MKDEQLDAMMKRIRAIGDEKFPTPFRNRSYQFPSNYPPSSKVRDSILDPLGVFLFALEAWRSGSATGPELEQQTAAFMTRHKAWKSDHPMYLVTRNLVEMLVQTDRLDEPNILTDSRPPFPAGHLVLPKRVIGTSDGAYVVCMSYAVLDRDDFIDTPIRYPDDMMNQRFYVTAEMSNGVSYFAKLLINEDGVVENPEDSPYSDDFLAKNPSAFMSGDEDVKETRFVVEDGPGILSMISNLVLSLFTFLNMDKDTCSSAEITGRMKARRGKPGREFWKAAVIGANLRPSGMATQGSHASPNAHLRRGHWRWQHFGKDNSQRKRLWIKPTLVMGRSA